MNTANKNNTRVYYNMYRRVIRRDFSGFLHYIIILLLDLGCEFIAKYIYFSFAHRRRRRIDFYFLNSKFFFNFPFIPQYNVGMLV